MRALRHSPVILLFRADCESPARRDGLHNAHHYSLSKWMKLRVLLRKCEVPVETVAGARVLSRSSLFPYSFFFFFLFFLCRFFISLRDRAGLHIHRASR